MTRWKIGEYKEDSTKGKAMMRPRTYKGDSLVQVWIDRRWLASLSVWLESNGVRTRHMSDVLRESLRELYEHLIKTGEVSEIDTTEAGNILEDRYRVELNPGGRGGRNLLHNKLLSTYKGEETEFRSGQSKLSEMQECTDVTVNRVEVSENDPLVGVAKKAMARIESMKEFKFEPEKIEPVRSELAEKLSTLTGEERIAFIQACRKKNAEEAKQKQEVVKRLTVDEEIEKKRVETLNKAKRTKDDLTPRPITDGEWAERVKKEQEQTALFNSDAMLGPK